MGLVQEETWEGSSVKEELALTVLGFLFLPGEVSAISAAGFSPSLPGVLDLWGRCFWGVSSFQLHALPPLQS